MKKHLVKCSWCKNKILRFTVNRCTGKPIKNSFCNNNCKGEWQRKFNKPVSKEWLLNKYLNEKLNCVQISKIVKRDPKRVWEWLVDYGLEMRGRGYDNSRQWKEGIRIPTFTGRKHTDETKNKIRNARILDGNVPYKMPDGSHYMKGRFGKKHHLWKGGLTPERERLYQTREWKDLVKSVWKRDKANCQICNKKHNTLENRGSFHIHHIAPFNIEKKRMMLSNLILLCRSCHIWVHSKKNVEKILIEKE